MYWKRWRAGRTLAVLGAAATLVPAAGCVALAVAAPQKQSDDATPPSLRGLLLVGKAEEQVARADRECGGTLHPKPQLRFGAGAPSAGLVSTVGVLRRPQTAAEQAAPVPSRSPVARGDITFFRSATRIVQGPGRASATIEVGSGRKSVAELFEPACQRRVVAALAKLTKGQPAAVRRAAESYRRTQLRSFAVRGMHEWVALHVTGMIQWLFPWDADSFRAHGLVAVVEGSTNAAVGIVPDGVASVTVHLAGHRPPSPEELLIEPSGSKPKVRRGGTITASVTDNVFFMPLPEPPSDAAVSRTTWRDANGRVIHVTSVG